MRTSTPEPFDENEDYPIGRRLSFNGNVLIVEPYSHKMEVLSMEMKLGNRCVICGVNKICHMQIKCRKYERKDRTQVYFKVKKFDTNGKIKDQLDLMIDNKINF